METPLAHLAASLRRPPAGWLRDVDAAHTAAVRDDDKVRQGTTHHREHEQLHYSAADIEMQAREAYARGEFASCHYFCETLLRLQPDCAHHYILASAVRFQLNEFEPSLHASLHAIKLGGDNPPAEAFSNAGNAYRALGQLETAEGMYLSAIRIKPHYPDAHGNLASLYMCMERHDEAISYFREALAQAPTNPCWMVDIGHLLRMKRDVPQARTWFERATELSPSFAIAWSNLACVCKDQGETQTAIEYFKRAVELDPGLLDAYSNLGNLYKDTGRLLEAEEMYLKALGIQPNHAIVIGNLGSVQLELGRVEEALATFKQALRLLPDFPDCLSNMGNALRALGRHEEALASYVRCLELTNWTHCDGLNNAANAYKDLGDAVTAERLYRKATEYRPRFAGAHSNLGNLLKEQFKLSEALEQYEKALSADPLFADAWSNLGNCLKDLMRFDDAIAAYEKAISIRPTFADAYGNLASVYKDTGVLEKAIQYYRKSLELKKGVLDPIAFCNLVHCLQTVCDWSERDDMFNKTRMILAQQMKEGRTPAVQPHHALVYPLPPEQQLQISAHTAHAAHRTISMMGLTPYTWPIDKEAAKLRERRRLRIGYVSSDFGNHPLAHLMQHVFVWHDKSAFEVFCYATSTDDGSRWRKLIRDGVEHFKEVINLPHVDLARLIYDDQVDVLINLNGYTKGSRTEVFALCPAPIQVMYMGFPGSSGAAYMDYFVTDAVCTPPELAHLFTERLAYMPHAYFVNDHMQSYHDCAKDLTEEEVNVGRARFGLPPRPSVVYCMHNQLYKIDPEVFRTWVRVLQRVPGSVLWLLQFPAAGELHIRREAERLGLPASRLIFSPVAEKVDHLMRGRLADVFLDTPLCNAHTTGTDILWGGVPLVTLPGSTLASRVAASLLHAVGCSELVASDMGHYEAIAVALGTDLRLLRELQDKVRRARWLQPLFDTRRWMADWQRLLAAIVADHRTMCAMGVDPRALTALRARGAYERGVAVAPVPAPLKAAGFSHALSISPVATPMFSAPVPVAYAPADGPTQQRGVRGR